jgi:hypothetical protein
LILALLFTLIFTELAVIGVLIFRLIKAFGCFGDNILKQIGKVQAEAGKSRNDAEEPMFKLTDAKMQEGLSNLLSYDPMKKKQEGGDI